MERIISMAIYASVLLAWGALIVSIVKEIATRRRLRDQRRAGWVERNRWFIRYLIRPDG
jgi:hypothetical protein